MERHPGSPGGSGLVLGDELPELEEFELLAQRTDAHEPARRVAIDEGGLESVVIADVSEEDETQPRVPLSVLARSSAPDLEFHEEDPLDSRPMPVFESRRALPTYDHRHDATIVLPRRGPRAGLGPVSRLAPHHLYGLIVALVITGCAAAFMIGAALTSLVRGSAHAAAPPAPSVSASAGLIGSARAVDNEDPVTLTDLPVDDD